MLRHGGGGGGRSSDREGEGKREEGMGFRVLVYRRRAVAWAGGGVLLKVPACQRLLAQFFFFIFLFLPKKI